MEDAFALGQKERRLRSCDLNGILVIIGIPDDRVGENLWFTCEPSRCFDNTLWKLAVSIISREGAVDLGYSVGVLGEKFPCPRLASLILGNCYATFGQLESCIALHH